MVKIEAVIFDYGKVLSLDQCSDRVANMAELLTTPREQFLSSYWSYRLDYDRGDLNAEAYWGNVGSQLARQVDSDTRARLVEEDIRSWLRPNHDMIGWALELHTAGLLIGLLSNMPSDLAEAVESDCDWLPEFHHRTFSCAVRSVKPDRRIYEDCLAGLGVEPSAALFLDDRPENIDAARDIGMEAHQFSDAATLKRWLQEHSHDTLREELPHPRS